MRNTLDRVARDVVQRVPVPQALKQLRKKRRQTLRADAVRCRRAHAQQRHFGGTIARWAPSPRRHRLLSWWMAQQHQGVLPRVAGDRTELVQEPPLLAPARVHVPRRQSPRQVEPTGLLHRLIVIVSGRICFEADCPCRVGEILRQRGESVPSALYLTDFHLKVRLPGPQNGPWCSNGCSSPDASACISVQPPVSSRESAPHVCEPPELCVSLPAACQSSMRGRQVATGHRPESRTQSKDGSHLAAPRHRPPLSPRPDRACVAKTLQWSLTI